MYSLRDAAKACTDTLPAKGRACGFVGVFLGACLLCVSCGGKTQAQRMEELESASVESQLRIAEMENKLDGLDNRVAGLSKDVQDLSTGSYEVRNRAGQKTGMTARFVAPAPRSVPVPVPVAPQAQAAPQMPPAQAPAAVAASAPSQKVVPPPAAPQRGNSSHALALPPTGAAMSTPGPEVSPGLPPEVSQAVAASAPMPNAKAVVPAPSAAPVPTPSLALPPETHGKPVPAPTATPAAPVAPEAKLPPAAQGEQAAYNAALALITSGRAVEGREKFQVFLQQFPSGRLAANAHYWIGESYYSQRNYPEALLEFKQVSALFPRHHKAADALLKAGMTYQKLGDKENAGLQFKALLADFPQSEAARIARSKGWGR